MEAIHLIKSRIAVLKEKELRGRLNPEEQLELGKLYITDEVNEVYTKESELNKSKYWEQRCELAEIALIQAGNLLTKTQSTKLSLDIEMKYLESHTVYVNFINSHKQPES